MFNSSSSSPMQQPTTSTVPYRFNPYDADHSKVFIGAAENQSIGYAGSSISSTRANTPRAKAESADHFLPQQDQYYEHQMQWHQNQLQYQDQYYQYPTEQEEEVDTAPVFTRQPPHGTLHQQLSGHINFCLYPTVAFENLEPTLPKHQMVRMFIGQLPYNVTPMQLGWLLYTFGNGAELYHFERITKTDHSRGGIKVPTGCAHFHTRAEHVAPLLEVLNDRLLIDDTGIWVAENAAERQLLADYCYGMKRDKTRRFQGRPYGTVVAQRSTSTFDPDTFIPFHARVVPSGAFRSHHF